MKYDKEMMALHEAYDKHYPVWVATLIGPTGMRGRKLVVAVGSCLCGGSVFTSLTAYAPTEQEPLEEWFWEKVPHQSAGQISNAWQEAFANLMSHNASLAAAYKISSETQKQKAETTGGTK
jgi:hypothetical protein